MGLGVQLAQRWRAAFLLCRHRTLQAIVSVWAAAGRMLKDCFKTHAKGLCVWLHLHMIP